MANLTVESQIERAKIQGMLSNWRLTPATFAYKITGGSWIPKKHLLLISTKIATAVAQGNGRLIVSMPPRHGKSELCSVHTPCWFLEKYPEKRVILSSYGADLSVGFSRRVRDTFMNKDNFDLLKTRLEGAKSVDQFLTDKGGGMYSMGVGGPITGRGADLLLIDDYIKEIKEALSPSQRQYLWDWFATTAFTRLEPNATVVIIATRWHSDDLIGRVLKNMVGHGWDYIEIPAIAEKNDPIGREVGQPLFPERYSLKALRERKAVLGNAYFQAIYQQKPVDETNKIADASWLQIVKAVPDIQGFQSARCWDLASSEEGGDFTVGVKVMYHKDTDRMWITDIRRGQWSPGQVEKAVAAFAQLDGKDCTVIIEREPGSSGKLLEEAYTNRVLKGYRVIPVTTSSHKVVRAQPFLAAAENGKIYVVEGDWNKEFLQEFDMFPGGFGTFDDQVDAAGSAYAKLSGKKAFSASWGRQKDTTNHNYASRVNIKNTRAAFQKLGGKSATRVTFGR